MANRPRKASTRWIVNPVIITQRDQVWWFKLNGAMRHAIARGALNAVAPPIVLTEYPKSGGTWMSQMLSAALEIPYPRNRLPHLRRQILHGCYRRVSPNVKTIVQWRDGRDTMVSFYYHLMFEKPITSAKYSQAVIQKLHVKDVYDVETYLPRFIEWAFEGGYPGYSWSDFVSIWHEKPGHIETSYEGISRDPKGELAKILEFLGVSILGDDHSIDETIQEYSFENQARRKPGEEDVTQFVRKGIVGDWKGRFNREAREVFNHYAGAELIKLRYESDKSWIDEPIAASESDA